MTKDDRPDPDALAGVAIDRAGEIPIGVQLAWALRARIGDGRLAAGQRLPGVRDLAEAVAVNVNTVRAVYQRLEREGLIESRHGTGTFVAGDANSRSDAGAMAAEVASRARAQGMDPREVAAALYVTSEATVPNAGAERRRQLRDQIAALEGALAEMASAERALPRPRLLADAGTQADQKLDRPRPPGPRLLSIEELKQVRADLLHRLTEAQSTLDTRTRAAAEDGRRAKAAQRETTKAPGHDAKALGRETAKASKRGRAPRPSARPSTA
jgi:DNA-binding transcriptional regulator YhcF (GntR family)